MEDRDASLANEKRWLANSRLALAKWKSVPESSIVPCLRQWFCGTQACFGGHLLGWPEFQEMGVYPKSNGEPMMVTPSRDIVAPDQVSYYLFGSYSMFYSKASYLNCSDHQCIVNRLEYQIRKLEQLIERTA